MGPFTFMLFPPAPLSLQRLDPAHDVPSGLSRAQAVAGSETPRQPDHRTPFRRRAPSSEGRLGNAVLPPRYGSVASISTGRGQAGFASPGAAQSPLPNSASASASAS